MKHDIQEVIKYSMHKMTLNSKDFISIIHTRKNNTNRVYNTIIFNIKDNELNPIKIVSHFDYSRRFDLKPEFYAEPFYNPDMPTPTQADRFNFLKYLSQDMF